MKRKLVRDKIPQIASHRTFTLATPEELSQLVTDKILEEANETILAAHNPEFLTEELADLFTVMQKLAQVKGIDWDAVLTKAKEKNVEKGEFNDNWVLEL